MRITSLKRIDNDHFVVNMNDSGRSLVRPIEVQRITSDSKTVYIISSSDAEFHNYIGGDINFKKELFRRVKETDKQIKAVV